MVAAEHAVIGAEVEVAMPAGPAAARIVERPFHDPKKTLAAA